MGKWDRKQRLHSHMEIGKNGAFPCCHFAKFIGLFSSWRVDPSGGSSPLLFHQGQTSRHRDFSIMDRPTEGHVFQVQLRFAVECRVEAFCTETEVNKQRTFFLKGRNQFSSEVWRVVGLINCGYAEVGSSFQDILDTRSYVLCTKSIKKQTLSNSSKGPKEYISYIYIYIYTIYQHLILICMIFVIFII